ncbi:hypothetical protein GPJ56_011068 [Histomonas meleagridis]|uniref:uncharacterized protein n=1 Tax=Histomonas meleagridis TaxID=135588 RepID=UPI00355ACAD8|nr:hypothetical protein GPJ56_011068 [Histomonas meleagridis]KAH0800845.1 hypothetical protein GO595_006598 [Histomonas meleagridis]
MSISLDEFQRVQNEVLRYKTENHNLREQLKNLGTNSQTFLQSLFSSSENAEIERLQKEETELKNSLANIEEHNKAIKDQIREANLPTSQTDQISILESLFLTKKRELTRMKELNSTTLSDLEEEVNLARELCDSLESGRSSLLRDKEVLDSSILSLQGTKQTISSRIQDLQQLNQQLRSDLGVKASNETENADVISQVSNANQRLSELEQELSTMTKSFEDEETHLSQILESKSKEWATIDEQNKAKTADIENQLKSLRLELQSLKKPTVAETVEIDVETLMTENTALQTRAEQLEERKKELQNIVMKNQIDCSFLADWIKKEQPTKKNADTVFKELIQKELEAKEELAKLQNETNSKK